MNEYKLPGCGPEEKGCNTCYFIGIWHCFHPENYCREKISFDMYTNDGCNLWRKGKKRPIIIEGKGNCSKCNKQLPFSELINVGKGSSFCKECI